jgi:amino-acid N-acetyltransferase
MWWRRRWRGIPWEPGLSGKAEDVGGLISLHTPRVSESIPLDLSLPLAVRKARMSDVSEMLGLINDYAAQAIMLPRTEFEMSENIRDFSVVTAGGRIAGCAALHFYTPVSAEVRSLAVDPAWKTHGLGRKLVEELEREAREHGLTSLFAFTYVPGFFSKLGYTQVDRGELPLKAWKDCLRCPKFQCCDEIAMLKTL